MILFLISVIVCIVVHELGHLYAAFACKCGVEKIALGFSWKCFKTLYSFKFRNLTIEINPILLGGFVKLKQETAYSRAKNAFTNLRYSKKLFITYAGIIVNCVTGFISYKLGIMFQNYNLFYFGWISLALGLTNALPIPALDGSYPFLVLLEKKYGKKRGYELMSKWCRWGFIIIMTSNIACIPYLIMHWRQL